MIRQFVSYPKSGRTWIRYALNQLKLDDGIAFHHDRFEFNDAAKPPHDFGLADRLRRYAEIDRLVYLERDPRDVMVSLYFQVTGRFRDFFDYRGSVSDFLRDAYFGAQNLARFRELWSEIAPRFGFLRISYEACHADMAGTLGAVLEYYGLEAGSKQIRSAVDGADFENMKRVERSGVFPEPWLRPRLGAPKVRRGKVGGFRDVLQEDDIAYLDRIFGLKP